MGRYMWEDLKPEPQNTWETDLINSKLNHKDNDKINDNKQVIQKNNEIQHIIQPKLMSNAKQTKMRKRWEEYESKGAKDPPQTHL